MSRKVIYIPLGILALILLVGCGQSGTPIVSEPTNTVEISPAPPTAEKILPTATSEAEAVESTPVNAQEDEPTDECLECHTDKQRLIDTAKPEEEVVSESSGEG